MERPNPAANQLVDRLVEIGILREMTGHARHRRFQYQPYVQIFAEESGGDVPAR
ncbi:MAG TPA: hypothetical protein VKS60_00445 [Stellaceae bacterium]|nr:hypothetical protein [Stellaceae bacterium]